jgi:hypothetical protein
MLAEYRRLQAGSLLDWGHEVPRLPGAEYSRFLELSQLWPAVAETGDWSEAVRRCVPDPPPRGLIVARVSSTGTELLAGPLPLLVPGTTTEVGVLIDSTVDEDLQVTMADQRIHVRPRAVKLTSATISSDRSTVTINDSTIVAGDSVLGARLLLRAGAPSRWSVVDERGQAWFPEGRLHKWDYHGRPFFHGDDIVLDVPASSLTVSCTRGMEFAPATATVVAESGGETVVELNPVRRYDAAARGWYGGDLHVHMNYSGDLVCSPHDAALMQFGEGLHLMNLVAGNMLGARIYDREAFEQFAGEDLPWSTEDRLGRWGVEFRNDLLGHFHALGPISPPERYQTGHSGAAHPEDWPPNATACEDLRSLGATIGYTHPVLSPLGDGTPAGAFVDPRSTEARELVADAALGLVDSIDLLGPNDPEGTAVLYHHLLNCGIKLAATVGTDVFLSHSKSKLFSNPPGWGRVYADLGDEPLTVDAWQAAIRAGRTFATNGPWLELTVGDGGPGDEIDADSGVTLTARARVEGAGVEVLELVGPDGTVATSEGPDLEARFVVTEPGWLAAIARGPMHPDVLGPTVFAHTTPFYINVDGRRVARKKSADWCLDWLDRVEVLASEHGHFADESQLRDLISVLDQARHFYRGVRADA